MYPPQHHIEDDVNKIYAVIEAFPFATLISRTEDDVAVTHLPLVLHRERGKKGTLIGHLDRNNPHARYLDDEKIFVLFHGPDTYISPTVYESTQLPTWNSISVHIRGTVSIIESIDEVRDSLVHMTERMEENEDAYVLTPDNQKMHHLLKYIVGFEIEIEDMIGRFKLSQDKNHRDMHLAKEHLIDQTKRGSEKLINRILPTDPDTE